MEVGKILKILPVLLILSGCIQEKISGEDIVIKMKEKYANISSYKTEIHVEEITDGKMQTYGFEVAFKKPDKFRVDENNNTTISNGEKLWFYNKDKKEVRVQDLNSDAADLFYGLFLDMLDDYKVEVVGKGQLKGKDCYILNLTPKIQKFRETQLQKLWVVKNEWYPVKLQMRVEFRFPEWINRTDFSSTLTFEYQYFEFDSVKDEEFEFEIPEGAEVVIINPYSMQ